MLPYFGPGIIPGDPSQVKCEPIAAPNAALSVPAPFDELRVTRPSTGQGGPAGPLRIARRRLDVTLSAVEG